MSFASVLDLPSSTRALPYNGKRIYLKFYNKSIKMRNSPSVADAIAWTAVKRKYYCDAGEWLPFADANDYDTTPTEDSSSSCTTTDNETHFTDDEI
ncbi:ORF59 [Lymantria xylina nucleopolyhedrovirus]|uniref:ORF59 n=1 Tax=Lymantria xylina multiple nucleopolyhedrovirus TaxID=2847840 RepID=D4N296_9ABAC|nr:ORF59 [Lymantria xylina nucleopolyhedrovirus]ADD73768.1 ORF59 [Lymantria xylina nucleopolyhedrovirus]